LQLWLHLVWTMETLFFMVSTTMCFRNKGPEHCDETYHPQKKVRCQTASHRMSLCALWVLIAAWNFPSEVILLEHELLTIPEDKQEDAPSELWKCIKVTCTDTGQHLHCGTISQATSDMNNQWEFSRNNWKHIFLDLPMLILSSLWCAVTMYFYFLMSHVCFNSWWNCF
jgi:hypothetical protein